VCLKQTRTCAVLKKYEAFDEKFSIDFVFCEVCKLSTGGLRWGAGRPAFKIKAERAHRIDVRLLDRNGNLNIDRIFTWQWQYGDQPAGSITIETQARSKITLQYSIKVNGKCNSVVQPIVLTYTQCHFGKNRPWLLCPHCSKRVALLYLRWGVFRCRTCQQATYSSQSEDSLDRLWRRQSKIEAKLNNKSWERPKGMHLNTYKRLNKELLAIQITREYAIDEYASKIFSKHGDCW
jgi:hypothetical protein